MDKKNFVLSYYKNSAENFHIHMVSNSVEAKKPHTHDFFQIYYIMKGALLHYVENESSRLVQGDMFIIPPGAIHYIKPDADAVFYSFSFMPDFFDETAISNRIVSDFLKSIKPDKPKISISSKEFMQAESIMEQILKEFNEKPLGYIETIRSYATILITLLARNYLKTDKAALKPRFENKRQFVIHCINYIEHNFTDDISLEEIAKQSAMSKVGFCSLFSELTGHSFNKFLNICRIKKAIEYINKGYKISAVYGLCGYNDFSTFYRNFKKITGVSPKEYKNNL